MGELLGKFWDFYGNLVGYFWKSFFEEPAVLFRAVAENPTASGWELVICTFLVLVAATMVSGFIRSVVAMSPLPFIEHVERFTRTVAYIGSYVLVILIVSMVYEVVGRYFFDAPTKWAFEAAYMLMGTSFMFGIAFCMQQRRHVRVDFLYDNVGDKGRALIDLFGYFLMVPMLVWLCAGLWEYFFAAYTVEETSGESAWNPIIWPFKFTLVIGFVMLFMQTIVEIVKSLMRLAGKDVPMPIQVETH
jgi:TRAP-type mannitol/chloroaromatic compound transport system permease small subunit